MSIGSLNSIKAALGTDKLQEDEKLVLSALVSSGYDKDGKPKGRDGILSAKALAEVIYPLLYDAPSPSWNEEKCRIETCKRRVRKAVNSLIITHGISICPVAGIGGGYFLPENAADVEMFHSSFHRRAMTGLVKASRGRKAAYADSMIQLTIGFEDAAKAYHDGLGVLGLDDGPPAWVQVVTGLLQQVQGDPEKYAEEIRHIQATCGDIFVRRDQVARIKQLSGELNKVLEGLQA